MREILFRAKANKKGWVYGFPNIYDDGSFFFVDAEKLNKLYPLDMCDVNEIIEGTLSQFTGLTDKNGKNIFEGDIVKCDGEGVFDGILGCVVYSDGYFSIDYIKPVCDGFKGIAIGLLIDENNICCVEVIGNIFDKEIYNGD